MSAPTGPEGAAQEPNLLIPKQPTRDSVVYADSIPIPRGKDRRIYLRAPVESGNWEQADYAERFRFVSNELKRAVDEDPCVRDRACVISYSLLMTGKTPEEAEPSIVVTCFDRDFNALRALFKGRLQDRLYSGKKSKPYHLFRKEGVPPLRLVFYQTPRGPITRAAASGLLKARPNTPLTLCGALFYSPSLDRTATLGLCIYADGVELALTVDHLFTTNVPRSNECLDTASEVSLGRSSDSDVSTLNDEDMEELGNLYYLDDSEEYLDYDPPPDMEPFIQGDIQVPNSPQASELEDNTTQDWIGCRVEGSVDLDPTAPYLDWALVKQQEPVKPIGSGNIIFPKGLYGSHIMLRQVAREPRCHLAPVYLISGLRGVISGQIMSIPTMIGSAPGKDLCEVWTVILDSGFGSGLAKGECGSAVVDQETREVYGHVIGTSPLGFVYVSPLMQVMKQIKVSFDVNEVGITPPTEPAPVPSNETQQEEVPQDGGLSSTRKIATGVCLDAPSKEDTPKQAVENAKHALSGEQTEPRDPDCATAETGDQLPAALVQIPSISVNDTPVFGYDSPSMDAQLRKAMVQGERGRFLPDGELNTIITKESVARLLLQSADWKRIDSAYQVASSPNSNLHAIVERVCGSFKRVFALLVLMKKAQTITEFLQEEVCDIDLPLSCEWSNEHLFLYRRTDPGLPLACVREWYDYEIEYFTDRQWAVLAPIFADHQTPYELSDHAILPFVAEDSYSRNEEVFGGYSSVRKVKIHPDHHRFAKYTPGNNSFAMKALHSTSAETFHREANLLKKFREGDLLGFWKEFHPQPPKADYKMTLWVAEQCAGIAQALAKIHSSDEPLDAEESSQDTAERRYGRHGDIKPENILWFKGPRYPDDHGSLVLGDFGLGKLHTKMSRSMSNDRRYNLAGTDTYNPPEFEMTHGTISRASDIWSLGCVYLEFITWYLGGWKSVLESSDERYAKTRHLPWLYTDAYYSIDWEDEPPVAKVKPAVQRAISRLRVDGESTQFVHDFLDIIELHMLRVSPSERIKADSLATRLRDLWSRCQINHDGSDITTEKDRSDPDIQ
ncbi:kinase-like protein [Canariomyces notabilis]|uniref:Kinase-like protein n=1 Tax=Canariomyces notabilis TaxID=2074819 RepID=A0AAN6TEE7_9PEZI|nr:kinase-like protein [Canariomyces arenarius]